MSQWPSTKARKVLAALLKIGWSVKREASGSHKVLEREQVIKPVLAGICKTRRGPKPKHTNSDDERYESVRVEMNHLLEGLGIAT